MAGVTIGAEVEVVTEAGVADRGSAVEEEVAGGEDSEVVAVDGEDTGASMRMWDRVTAAAAWNIRSIMLASSTGVDWEAFLFLEGASLSWDVYCVMMNTIYHRKAREGADVSFFSRICTVL